MNTSHPNASLPLPDIFEAIQRKALSTLNDCLDSAQTLKDRLQVVTAIARFKLVKPVEPNTPKNAQSAPTTRARVAPAHDNTVESEAPPTPQATTGDDNFDYDDTNARLDVLNALLDRVESQLDAQSLPRPKPNSRSGMNSAAAELSDAAGQAARRQMGDSPLTLGPAASEPGKRLGSA